LLGNGTEAQEQAFDNPHPPLAILDFYGAKCFSDPFWSQPQEGMPEHFKESRPQDEVDALYNEKTTFIGGVSLEGQPSTNSGGRKKAGESPNQEARQAFAMHVLSTGCIIPTIYPPYQDSLKPIDPLFNVHSKWPPTAIVHGTADTMIPMRLSKTFETELKKWVVETEFIEVEGEPHTFCGKMEKGSRTWDTQKRGFDFLERVLQRSYK
jgi:acetyl esterase/lipase